MSIWTIIGVILVISFLWSLFSLKREKGKVSEVEHVKKELEKEKVLFKL